jgi:transposase
MNNVKRAGRGVNDKTVVAAIDIGKEHNTGILYSQVYEMKKSFVFQNDRSGFEVLWDHITEVKQRYGLSEVIVVIESTGSYGEPLQNYAQAHGARLWQVNPHHTKRLREVVDNSPEKSDAKDPRVILATFLLGKGLTVVIPEGAYGELRSLSHARERGIEQRVRWENQLESIMFTLFPEFDRVMHGFKSRSSQRILSCWPTPGAVVKCGVAQLAVELRRVSRGRLGQERAVALYTAAQRSVGVPQGSESAVMEVRQLLSLLEAERTYLDGLEAQMEKHLDQIPMSSHLLSIRGVGVVTVAGLLGEYGDWGIHLTHQPPTGCVAGFKPLACLMISRYLV